jgi:hypothetical protein
LTQIHRLRRFKDSKIIHPIDIHYQNLQREMHLTLRQNHPKRLAAGVEVDGYSFAGLVRTDGAPVKDLNDFAHVCPDHWEAERDEIEEAFSFAAGSPQEGDFEAGNTSERDAIAAE